MGDNACWLHLVCDACGRIHDHRDDEHEHHGSLEHPSHPTCEIEGERPAQPPTRT